MAKELPYFEFEPAEYLSGNISFCSLEAQGLFILICCYYWQRSCKLTSKQILRRFDNDTEWTELFEEGVVEWDTETDEIAIKFLDEKFDKATKRSRVNSQNGSKGGRPKKEKETEKKPNGNQKESNSKGIIEDKIKEDKIKEEESVSHTHGSFDSLKLKIEDLKTSRQHLENLRRAYTLSEKQIFEKIELFWLENSATFEPNKSLKDLQRHFGNWLRITMKRENESNTTQKGINLNDV